MKPTKATILVLAAAGSTGMQVTLQLLDEGFPVKAFVRREDARSEALKSRGVELFVGDFADFRAVRRAMEGTMGSYFCYPIAPGIVQASAQWA